MDEHSSQRTMGVKEAAQVLRCSESSLKRWEREPSFPAPRRTDDVKEWRVYTAADIQRIQDWIRRRKEERQWNRVRER